MSDVLVDFDLSYPVYFEEEGSVWFKYRKDSIGNEAISYGSFSFLIDDTLQYEDKEIGDAGWQEVYRDMIPKGYHSFVWRYTKLNMLPYTEFMEAEIEEIVVRGRHSDRLTKCYPCNLGHSLPGSNKCQLCEANKFFYIDEETDEFYCKQCPEGHYSAEGSVGEMAC